jgi:hypothetical protein
MTLNYELENHIRSQASHGIPATATEARYLLMHLDSARAVINGVWHRGEGGGHSLADCQSIGCEAPYHLVIDGAASRAIKNGYNPAVKLYAGTHPAVTGQDVNAEYHRREAEFFEAAEMARKAEKQRTETEGK